MKRFLTIVGSAVLTLAALVGVLKLQSSGGRQADAAPIERHRPQMLAQLDRLKGVAAQLEDLAPLDTDSASLPLPSARFEKHATPVPDGALVDAGQLTDEMLSKDFSQPHRLTLDDHPFWGRCIAWVHTGRSPDGDPPRFANVIEEEIERFLAVKYLGVARIVEYRAPELAEADTFSGGRYRYDLFFFELAEEPRYLGGFRVDAVNAPKVRTEYREKTRSIDQAEWLIRNLRYQAQAGWIAGLRDRAPGVVTPDPDYYQADLEKSGY